MPNIRNRIERLEAERPDTRLTGWDRFIWHGPEDNAALGEAEATAEAAKRSLIIIRIVEPPPAPERLPASLAF